MSPLELDSEVETSTNWREPILAPDDLADALWLEGSMAWFYDAYSKARVPEFRWPEGAQLAVCFHSAFEAWSESQDPRLVAFRQSQQDMPPMPPEATSRYDFTSASEHDYGGRIGVWRILELLEKYKIPSTFATSGVCVERYPEAVKAIVLQGHEICAHNWEQDVRAFFMERVEERAMIQKCVSAFNDLTGRRPVGWISPGALFTTHTPGLLAEEGFIWHGDFLNDDAPYFCETGDKHLVAIPLRRARIGLNDMHLSRGGNPRELLQRFIDEFDVLYAEGTRTPRMLTTVMHTELHTPQTSRVYEEMMKYAKSFPNVWFTNRGQIARWLLENYLPAGGTSNLA